ncbi:hypothetical protein AMQ84_04225 [Paenibacillus riograndensis]|uniref:Uncharacterized protein n=1 Tax=Paenibacillus riograndensis TaxID=483937 RepID=A0A132UA99_9BACL|nr:hypothetical protein AMQ84_04225 [Paenibacillus riograndensis]
MQLFLLGRNVPWQPIERDLSYHRLKTAQNPLNVLSNLVLIPAPCGNKGGMMLAWQMKQKNTAGA